MDMASSSTLSSLVPSSGAASDQALTSFSIDLAVSSYHRRVNKLLNIIVIPAKAGIQITPGKESVTGGDCSSIPAFAGMTG